ncbi:MAG: DUF1254 domain-containing protein [Candidatus Doudnabacteria bacterium]|nr:DUF1254 domain-containing protein [Candidatus Doudnabacteria bacterium]
MQHLLIFSGVCAAAFFLFTYLWPRLMLSAYKRAILHKGFGQGPIAVNTLFTEPQSLFANPMDKSYTGSKLAVTGVNRDTLYVMGWLDLNKEAQVMHVPDMAGSPRSTRVEAGRYYSMQFTDPSKNINFAYVGKRTTGTGAGDYLITGPNWKGAVPQGMKQVSSPNNSVLVIGRVIVKNDSDLPAAYNLSKQIQLTPLSRRQP